MRGSKGADGCRQRSIDTVGNLTLLTEALNLSIVAIIPGTGALDRKSREPSCRQLFDIRANPCVEYGSDPSKISDGSDAANIIIEALRKTGPKDKAAIAKAIRETSHDGAMGVTSFDENGQTKLPVELELREVKSGAWTTRAH
jgi:hypothetical protein